MSLVLKHLLQGHICRNWIRNHTLNTTGSMKYDVEKPWSSRSPPIRLLATAFLMHPRQ